MEDDLTGGEERGRHHDEHGVDVGEAAGGFALVVDAVLGTDDGDVGAGGGSQILEGGEGVLGLGGEDDDVVVAPGDFAGVVDGGDTFLGGLVGHADGEAVGEDAGEVGASGDQDDLVAVSVEEGADAAADRAGSVDDVAHRGWPSSRAASAPRKFEVGRQDGMEDGGRGL